MIKPVKTMIPMMVVTTTIMKNMRSTIHAMCSKHITIVIRMELVSTLILTLKHQSRNWEGLLTNQSTSRAVYLMDISIGMNVRYTHKNILRPHNRDNKI